LKINIKTKFVQVDFLPPCLRSLGFVFFCVALFSILGWRK